MFGRLTEHERFGLPKKRVLMKREVESTGLLVLENGILVDPITLKAIANWSKPLT